MKRPTFPARAVGLQLLLLLLLLASTRTAPSLRAQSVAAPPLPPHHWAYDLLEALDAAGFVDAWMYDVRPVSREVVRTALMEAAGADFAGAEIVERWLLHFDSLHPMMLPARPGSDPFEIEPGLTVGLGRFQRPMLDGGGRLYSNRASPLFLDGGGSYRLGPDHSGWVLFDSRQRNPQLFGLSAPIRSSSLMIGGQKIKAAGPGRTSTQMTGHLAMDAVYSVANERVRLPSFLRLPLGPLAWHAAAGPWGRVLGLGADDGFFLAGGAVIEPMRGLRVGLTRTVRFGHPDRGGLGVGDMLRAALYIPSESRLEDDQKVELSLRYRWSFGERSFATYLILAHDDGVPWRDPGLIAGATIPFVGEDRLYALRYEYAAFGARAGGTSPYRGQGGTQPPRWYHHPGFAQGLYVRDALPMGSPLGGYGASHTAELQLWSGVAGLRGKAWGFFEEREEGNFFHTLWPGTRWGGGVDFAFHMEERALEIGAAGLVAGGPEISAEWGLSIHVTWRGLRAVAGG